MADNAPALLEITKNLGPLAPLAGTWEGGGGTDVAPSDSRGTDTNPYRERMVLEPFGPVNNHEQTLWGLRYNTIAWKVGAADAFHEDHGYWLWDPKAKQVFRCSVVPRGIVFIAGGSAEASSREFKITAEVGSPTFGICSNPFLDAEFRTVRYDMKVTINDDGTFNYEQDTQMLMKGRDQLFHHVDTNKMKRVAG